MEKSYTTFRNAVFPRWPTSASRGNSNAFPTFHFSMVLASFSGAGFFEPASSQLLRPLGLKPEAGEILLLFGGRKGPRIQHDRTNCLSHMAGPAREEQFVRSFWILSPGDLRIQNDRANCLSHMASPAREEQVVRPFWILSPRGS